MNFDAFLLNPVTNILFKIRLIFANEMPSFFLAILHKDFHIWDVFILKKKKTKHQQNNLFLNRKGRRYVREIKEVFNSTFSEILHECDQSVLQTS